ncbi:MAG TPA: hypothetical protein VGA50_09115, partial [Kiloniellales bacterium]
GATSDDDATAIGASRQVDLNGVLQSGPGRGLAADQGVHAVHPDRRPLVRQADRKELVRESAVLRPLEGVLLDPLGLAAGQVRHSAVLA